MSLLSVIYVVIDMWVVLRGLVSGWGYWRFCVLFPVCMHCSTNLIILISIRRNYHPFLCKH